MNKTISTLILIWLSCFLTSQMLSQAVMDFDGINDNITVPNASSFIANSQLSISAWVYPTNPNPGWPDFDGIVGFRNDVSADFYLLHLSSTSIEARFRNSLGTNYDIVYNGINLNAWNHFVLTYDNSTLTLYHDGTSVMTTAASGSITSTTSALNIGFIPFQNNPFYFDGQLDDVALWDASLSSAQVTSLYSSCGLDTAASNLVLAYEFNDGVPGGNNAGIGSIIDSKSNANGVLSGFALTGTSSNFVGDSKALSTSFFSLTELSCGPYTSPSGTSVWTTSGIYSDTIFATAGCDSVYTIDLTVAAPSTDSLTIDECEFYISPAGNTWTVSGVYADTIPNATGCDSIISIDLRIENNSTASIEASACESYTSPSGEFVWTTSGVYEDTISNMAGCDSILLIDLTIGELSVSTVTDSACGSYTSPSGNYEWSVSGMYADTLASVAGCDSILSIDLTILNIDSSVTQIQSELIAHLSGASYQWIDCANGEAVAGATDQSFIAMTNGSYAVVISDNGCVDTSACFDVIISGLFDSKERLSFQLLPNPVEEMAILSFSKLLPSCEIRILNPLGQEIERRRVLNRQSIELDVSHLDQGMYFLQLIADEKIGLQKFLKI
ncbi:MAG: LamG-like jellyroll fold domain-containing protein [Bacteroidota bacterium]